MDPNDLLKLLNLDAAPPPVSETDVGASRLPVGLDATGAAGPTALDVDAWGLRRGRDLVAESERLRTAGADAFAAADFFTAAFEPDPQLLAACADPRRHRFLARLLQAPEYRALHAETALDDTAAAIAAGHFAERFAETKPDGASIAEAVEGCEGLADEVATLRAVGRALGEARKEVGELKETAAALGLGPGAPGANDPRVIAELFRRVRSDPGLRRICELAGRFRRVAGSKPQRRAAHGPGEVVGVEPGGEVGRLLPVELTRLAVPELELDVLRRIVEGQALCRERRATEPVGKGPVVVVVDESGSMEGARAHTAKALALALAWVARAQRRWCALVAYSGGSGERVLALPPARWDEGALCDWLAAFIGNGSDLDLPIAELPRMVRDLAAPAGVTDVVMVTDARARIPVALAASFNAWKETSRARVIALVLAAGAGDLAAVSDEVHLVPTLAPDEDAVGRVLAL